MPEHVQRELAFLCEGEHNVGCCYHIRLKHIRPYVMGLDFNVCEFQILIWCLELHFGNNDFVFVRFKTFGFRAEGGIYLVNSFLCHLVNFYLHPIFVRVSVHSVNWFFRSAATMINCRVPPILFVIN